MTTKEECGLPKVKRKYLNDEIITADPQKYKSINLSGKSDCCRNAKATFFESNSFESKKHKNDYESFKQSKQNSSFSNKFDKSLNKFEYFDLHNSSQKNLLNSWKKKKEKDSSKNTNSSTLSLHIAAYENSIDGFDKSVADKSLMLKKKKQSLKNEALSKSVIQNSFEFPRQQNNPPHVEVMSFRSSQTLMNPLQPPFPPPPVPPAPLLVHGVSMQEYIMLMGVCLLSILFFPVIIVTCLWSYLSWRFVNN